MIFSELWEKIRPVSAKRMPKAVFFLVGQEFCERFAFYGMRAVLMLYLTQELLLPRTDAKLIFHASAFINYFMPIFGAMLADIVLGKFKTIFYLSLVYALGNTVLSVSAIQLLQLPQLAFCISALIIIGVGAGGIKPCVSAFGGDQFGADEDEARDRFYAIFYFSINAGALISMFITPIFRAQVKCFGQDDCYPLAFGFPAFLFIVATVVFLIGKRFYRIYPPGGSVVIDFVKCSAHAIAVKLRTKQKREHWILHSTDKYDPDFVSDCRSVWDMFLLFLPLPMFWALFDQQGSAWTMQSAHMDGRLGDVMEIHPDQMDSLNSFLVICFIPLFSFGLYPLLGKCKLLKKPLQRMTVGGFLAGFAFILTGVLQYLIEQELPYYPPSDKTEIIFANTLPCPTRFQLGKQTFKINTYDFLTVKDFTPGKLTGTVTPDENLNCSFAATTVAVNVYGGNAYTFAIGAKENDLIFEQSTDSRTRNPKGQPMLRFIYAIQEGTGSIILKHESKEYVTKIKQPFGITDYINPLSNKDYELCWTKSSKCGDAFTSNFFSSKGGFFHVMFIVNNQTQITKQYTVVRADWLKILWQVPQYALVTAGEVMFSITGLSFAYSQAPYTMKSVLQAAWLLTVAFGNIIVIIIEEIKGLFAERLEYIGFFAYASLMIVDMLLFAFLAHRYTYKNVQPTPDVR